MWLQWRWCWKTYTLVHIIRWDWSSIEIDMLDENPAILSHYNIKCNSMKTCYGCCHRCLQMYKPIDSTRIEVFDYLFRMFNRRKMCVCFSSGHGTNILADTLNLLNKGRAGEWERERAREIVSQHFSCNPEAILYEIEILSIYSLSVP